MITINTKQYSSYRMSPDKNYLTGPNHDEGTVNDFVQFDRVTPAAGTTNSVARASLRLNRTFTIDTVKKPAVIKVDGSFPKGMLAADKLAMVADVAAALGLTEVQDLFSKLDINA